MLFSQPAQGVKTAALVPAQPVCPQTAPVPGPAAPADQVDPTLVPAVGQGPSVLPTERLIVPLFEVHVPTWEEKGGPCPALRDNPNRMLFVLGAGSTETVETLLDSVFPACRCDVALPSAEFAACQ